MNLVDYYDSHPEDQEEIHANVWEWWNMELDEMIEELGNPNELYVLMLSLLIKFITSNRR